MTLFKNTVLKRVSLFDFFKIEWLQIQATLVQAIQCMAYITKTWQNETQNGMFHLKIIAGDLTQNKST